MWEVSGRSYGGHESRSSVTTTWLTPPSITNDLGPFDLDPAGYPGWGTASRVLSDLTGDDGLAAEWSGRVWLNPPYDRVWIWLDKLAAHGRGTALIFARTETRGFVEQVWKKADGLRFLHGRLNFHRPDGSPAARNAGAPSVLVSYGPEDTDRLATSALPGSFVRLGQCPASLETRG